MKLNKTMIELLSSLKNKEFINYECDLEEEWNRTYAYLRINTSDISVDISNEQESKELFGELEDVSCFKCFNNRGKTIKESFNLIENYSTKTVDVNGIINKIYVISEIIEIDYKQVEFDMCIIIETSKHKYLFSRENWFDEFIYINIDKDFNDVYPINKDKEDWSFDNKNNITIKRNIIEI